MHTTNELFRNLSFQKSLKIMTVSSLHFCGKKGSFQFRFTYGNFHLLRYDVMLWLCTKYFLVKNTLRIFFDHDNSVAWSLFVRKFRGSVSFFVSLLLRWHIVYVFNPDTWFLPGFYLLDLLKIMVTFLELIPSLSTNDSLTQSLLSFFNSSKTTKDFCVWNM